MNPVFVIRQPKFSICTVIHVGIDQILTINHEDESVHKNLDKLREFSDIFFVFSKNKGEQVNSKKVIVNKDKFSNLYGACAWTCGEEDNIFPTIMDSLEYTVEVFRKHKVYLMTDLHRLVNASIDKDKLYEVALGGTSAPIMKINRLSSEELSNIYLSYETPSKFNWLKKLFKLNGDTEKINNDRRNSLYWSESDILFIRDYTIKNIITQLSDESFSDYLKSFSENDFTYAIASTIKCLDIKYINESVENIVWNSNKQEETKNTQKK